ncbi:MAG: hypothetical protein L6264_09370 [Weeksellaceae bacterium]|nr:hypothetical protein [Bacteroidota bacterium]MCG2781147.1 hypothetical protein [Weeksellaceae bacterium]
MKIIPFILFFMCCSLSAQQNLPFDSVRLRDVKDLFADDYGNIYLYKSKDFSFTKYDSVGKQKGKLMFALPFKIQSVQNPLNIPSFSENAQELKLYDQNLNEIQTINFRPKFGMIKMVYAEDLQQIWLLDESSKRLIQYAFRDDRIINSYPFDIDFEHIIDLIVYNNKVYILTDKHFSAYTFKSEKIFEIPSENGKRLRRENDNVLVLSKQAVKKLVNDSLITVFKEEKAQIVDKNSASNFVIKDNKLYLYPIQKEPAKK